MKKQEKKFVLAALALLAITGLLALAGCKNDSVPEPTRYTVKFDKNAEDASGEMQSQIFTEGVEQELSVNQFKRDTYTFSGWSEDKAATAPTYKDKAKFKATKDTTLYAVWTDNGTVALVTFSLPDDTKFYFDESIEVGLETTTEGATIQYHLGDGSWKDYDAGGKIQVTGDTTITTITAKATKEGLKPSTETTATYTVRKLEGITVTSPARTVYSVGQSFDPTGMEVTATYEGGEKREVTGWETDFSTVADVKGLNKPVTVSYREGNTTQDDTFTVDVVNVEEPTKLTSYSSPNHTGSEWTYIAFGEWPQTEAVDFKPTTAPQSHGIFVDNYYVEGNDKYVEEGGKYYKVEPIVWRVLTTSYKAPEGGTAGNALLLAEKILTGGIPYYDVWDTNRTVDGATIYSNNYEHSAVRAWLNGLKYQYKETDDAGQVEKEDYFGKGFLQTAFTESARDLIADTTVDNSAASTIPSEITDEDLESAWKSGENQYASKTPTTDKIFLLSEKEATTSEYGFAAYNVVAPDSTRIRVTTDYAKATGAYQGDSSAGYSGWWWLCSPDYVYAAYARIIDDYGGAYYYGNVNDTDGGVVPALSISLQ